MTVIGIAPRAYKGMRIGAQTDVWAPKEKEAVAILGRLKPDATIEQARAEMTVLFQFTIEERASRSKDPLVRQIKLDLESASTGLVHVRDQYGKPLVLLLAVVGLLLLLACVNIASMLLARSAGRQREMAVRVALGAGRGRLVRQVLTESVLLSGIGTLLGVVLAYAGTGALLRIMASGREFERVNIQVEPDWNLLLFTAGIGVLTGLLFGLAPAWQAFRSAPAASLRDAGRVGDNRFWRRVGKSLVIAQVALSMLLATGAVVFLNHVSRLRNLDLGFQSDHVLLMALDPAGTGYKRGQLAAPYRDLLKRLETIPGVLSVSISGCTPIQGCGASRFVTAEEFQERPEDRRWTALSWVAPRYFETLRTPLLAGRDFRFEDAGHPRVAIISESMARHYFPGVNPIGKHVSIDRDPRTGGWYGDDQPYEVVGVVGDAKAVELREAPPRSMYLNMFQEDQIFHQFSLRTSVDPSSVIADARRIAEDVFKTVNVTKITTLSDQVDGAIVAERLMATLSGFFGALGALLAGIGLYGLLGYTVARRTNEIGVRMAVGATVSDVRRLVLGDALTMVCAGLTIGAFLVFLSGPFAASLIEDLKLDSTGPLALGGGMLVMVALLAAYFPARRATRIDPMRALRHE